MTACPVILAFDDFARWLGEVPVSSAELKVMLKPYPAEFTTAWPVDRRVGNVMNEGPELAKPVAIAQ